MTNDDLLHIAQAFAYLEMKIDRALPESRQRAAAITKMEEAADLIMRAAAAEQVKTPTTVEKHLRLMS
jgi:hypothetical protein